MADSIPTGLGGSKDCNLKVGKECLTQANLRDICQTIINNSDHLIGVTLNPYAKQSGSDQVALTCFSKCEDDAYHIIEADVSLPWLSGIFRNFSSAPTRDKIYVSDIEISYLTNNEYVDKVNDLFGPKSFLQPEVKQAGIGIGLAVLVGAAVLFIVACSGESQDPIYYDTGDADDGQDSISVDIGSLPTDTADTTQTKKDIVDVAEPKDVPIDLGDVAEPKDTPVFEEVCADVFPQDIPDVSGLDSQEAETVSPVDVIGEEISPEDVIEPVDIPGELDAAVIPDIFDVVPEEISEPEDISEIPDIPDVSLEDTVEPIDISFQDEISVDTAPEDIGSELVDTTEPDPDVSVPDTAILPDIPVIQDIVEDEIGPEVEDAFEPELDVVEPITDTSVTADIGLEILDTSEPEPDIVVLPDIPIIEDTAPEDIGPELVDVSEPLPDISEPEPDIIVLPDIPVIKDVAEEVTPDAETSIDIFWPMTDVTDATDVDDASDDVGIDAALPVDIMFPPEDVVEEVEVVEDVSETTDTSEPGGIEYIDNLLDGFLVLTPYYDVERTEEMPISQFAFFINSDDPSLTSIPISLEFFLNDEEIPSNGIPLCDASALLPNISPCLDSGFPIGDIGSFDFYDISPTYGWENTWELYIPDATDTDDIVMQINSYPSEGGFYPLGLFVDVMSDGCVYFYSHYACGEYWASSTLQGFSKMCIAMNGYSGLPLQ